MGTETEKNALSSLQRDLSGINDKVVIKTFFFSEDKIYHRLCMRNVEGNKRNINGAKND